MRMSLVCKPIGVVHSPFSHLEDMPIQPTGARGVEGTVEIFSAYKAGLQDLDGFSHVIVLYHFHRSKDFKLQVVPFLDNTPRGLFATRAPKRPNPIGLSVLRLQRIDGCILYLEGVDMLDQTPVLDLKPYVPDFDMPGPVRTGWLAKVHKAVDRKRSDRRFR